MLDETKESEEKATKELNEAQARLDAKVEEVRKRTDLDERRKEMEIANQQQVEQKRLEVAKREIEDRMSALTQFITRNVLGLFGAISVIMAASMLFSFIAIEGIGLRANQMGMLRAGLLGAGAATFAGGTHGRDMQA